MELNVSGRHQGLMRCRSPGGRQEIGGRQEPTGGRQEPTGGRQEPTGGRLWDLPVDEGAFGTQGRAPTGPSSRRGRLRRPRGHDPVPPPLKYAPGTASQDQRLSTSI